MKAEKVTSRAGFMAEDGVLWNSKLEINGEGRSYSCLWQLHRTEANGRPVAQTEVVRMSTEVFRMFPDHQRIWFGQDLDLSRGLGARETEGLNLAGNLDREGRRSDEVREYRFNVRLPSGQALFTEAWTEPIELHPPGCEAAIRAIAGRVGGDVYRFPWAYYKGKDRDFPLARRALCWPEVSDAVLGLPREELRDAIEREEPAIIRRLLAALDSGGLHFDPEDRFDYERDITYHRSLF